MTSGRGKEKAGKEFKNRDKGKVSKTNWANELRLENSQVQLEQGDWRSDQSFTEYWMREAMYWTLLTRRRLIGRTRESETGRPDVAGVLSSAGPSLSRT